MNDSEANDSEAEFNTGVKRGDLYAKRARFLKTPWGEFALYESDGTIYCAQAFCPHMDGPLWEGSIQDGIVTCPWHSWRFRLTDGALIGAEDGEPDCRLRTCVTREATDGAIVLLAPRL